MAGIFDKLEGDLDSSFGAGMADAVKEVLLNEVSVKQTLALAEQVQVKKACDQLEARVAEGIGELRMQINPAFYWYWANREPGCWGDKGFRREFYRDNPEVRGPKLRKVPTILCDFEPAKG